MILLLLSLSFHLFILLLVLWFISTVSFPSSSLQLSGTAESLSHLPSLFYDQRQTADSLFPWEPDQQLLRPYNNKYNRRCLKSKRVNRVTPRPPKRRRPPTDRHHRLPPEQQAWCSLLKLGSKLESPASQTSSIDGLSCHGDG